MNAHAVVVAPQSKVGWDLSFMDWVLCGLLSAGRVGRLFLVSQAGGTPSPRCRSTEGQQRPNFDPLHFASKTTPLSAIARRRGLLVATDQSIGYAGRASTPGRFSRHYSA